MQVKIKRFSDNAKIPVRARAGDAGVKLYASENAAIEPSSSRLVHTGIGIELPEGYAAFVLPRSGLSLTTPLRVANSPGLIDSGYRGEIVVICDNLSATNPIFIKEGDGLAQLMVIRYENVDFEEVKELGESERGSVVST